MGLKFGVGGTASLVNYKRTNEINGSDSDGNYTIIVNLKKRDVIVVDLLPYVGMKINNIDVNFLFGLGYRKYRDEEDVKVNYTSGTYTGWTFSYTDQVYLKTHCFKTGIEIKYHPIKYLTVSFNCGYLITGSRTLELPSRTISNNKNSYTHTTTWTNNGTILKTVFQTLDFGIGVGFYL